MATPEQEEQARTELDAALGELGELEANELVRSELGIHFNFEEARPYIERILKLFADVRDCSFDGASHSCLSGLAKSATKALDIFKEIQEFSPEGQNPGDQRTALVNKVRDQFDPLYEQVTPRIAYAVRRGTDFDELEERARTAASTAADAVEDINKKSETFNKEASDALAALKQAAAEAGISAHATHFKDDATTHEKASTTWLARTGWVALATGLYALGLLLHWLYTVPPELTTGQSIQLAIAKLALLSVLLGVVAFCARTYRAHMHNATTNKQRANALSTFEAFMAAALDDTTKDGVLLYVAQAIFAPQTSGYLGGGDTERHAAAQVLEIFRGRTPAMPADET